jgi:hypothetical protein
MALPKIDLPLYELVLPSTGKKVKYRPFTVKEEKILLTAQESEDREQIILAIKQIINNCLVDCDVDKLAMFDIEYILILLRSKSVDNTVEFQIEDPDTKEKVNLALNLNDIKVKKNPKHTKEIKLDNQYWLHMRYPTMDEFASLLSKETITPAESFNILISCMDKLVSESEVFKFGDFSKKEIDEFVESLHGDTTRKMKEFFDTIPKVRHEIKYVNSAGTEKTYVLEGTQSFFI